APEVDDDLAGAVAEALGAAPAELLGTRNDPHDDRNLLAVFAQADDVRALAPNMAAVATLAGGIIVTAPGDEEGVDIVSRYFTPQHGIPEDPVTGSAHCTLGPFWCERLGRDVLRAAQVSARGGMLVVRPDGDRVLLTGDAVTVVTGALHLP
ncbi:MAG TPA: PhzF family phenazine biosynthesis protein, partial [Nitriliruptorales bacterium]